MNAEVLLVAICILLMGVQLGIYVFFCNFPLLYIYLPLFVKYAKRAWLVEFTLQITDIFSITEVRKYHIFEYSRN